MLCSEHILEAFNRWKFKEPLPEDAHKKVSETLMMCVFSMDCVDIGLISVLFLQVKLMCSYCKKHDETEVPDPYYGGPQGFEKVINDCFDFA